MARSLLLLLCVAAAAGAAHATRGFADADDFALSGGRHLLQTAADCAR